MDSTSPAPEFLTVRELAALLRVKERKVYDLVAAGEVPCSRVTGKLLFPEAEIRAWIAGASTGAPARAEAARPPIFLGSHDPLLEWALRQSQCGLATFFDGSLDGLTRFRAGEGVATGLHLQDPGTERWNIADVERECGGLNAVLVGFATRRRGLVLRRELAGEIRGLADLAGRRVVPRQPASGTQRLFVRHLQGAGLAEDALDYAPTARSEADAVQAVAEGGADAAFGLEALAATFNLQFVPLVEERFDLFADRAAWFEPPMQRFLAFCRSEDFRARARGFAGYDLSPLGEVRWNAP